MNSILFTRTTPTQRHASHQLAPREAWPRSVPAEAKHGRGTRRLAARFQDASPEQKAESPQNAEKAPLRWKEKLHYEENNQDGRH